MENGKRVLMCVCMLSYTCVCMCMYVCVVCMCITVVCRCTKNGKSIFKETVNREM